jgi:hypothetical protein
VTLLIVVFGLIALAVAGSKAAAFPAAGTVFYGGGTGYTLSEPNPVFGVRNHLIVFSRPPPESSR